MVSLDGPVPLDANGHLLTRDDTVHVLKIGGMPSMVDGVASRCGMCGQAPQYDIARERVRVVDPCPYPGGVTTVVDVAFPSGRIIVTDDLRPVYDWEDDGTFADYDCALGQAQATRAMAAVGCAYGPVGNTCPGLYRLAAPGRFIIANPSYGDDDEEYFSASEYQGAEKVASIITDLWAYSIADLAHWQSRGGDLTNRRWCDTVVDIAPGVYRFTHHTGERRFDHDADEPVFAHIERIGGC